MPESRWTASNWPQRKAVQHTTLSKEDVDRLRKKSARQHSAEPDQRKSQKS